ncbi:MAG: glycosyltransferase [Syntrophales bacterium]|nr:glycosyltransferase [Syntrophales bacterium]
MSEELITVVMPIFRTPDHYVRESIKSILAQDYAHLELIIIEDPSENIVEGIIREFCDARINYVLNPRRTSFVQQLNKGIGLAKGVFIARMDADDISESHRLRLQQLFLQEHPDITAVGSNLMVIDEQGAFMGSRAYPEGSEDIAIKMRIRNVMAHPAVMFRKKDYLEVGGYDEDFDTIADYHLWIKMLQAGKKIYNIQQPLLRYRVHFGATKGYLLKKQLRDTLRIKKKYFRYKKGWNSFCEMRFMSEYMMTALPSRWIYALFVKFNIRK